MNKSISMLDKDYTKWVKELALRYRNSQIKASIKVNTELLKYNWMLGRDIVEMKVEERWGEKVISSLSVDLQNENPNITGFSRRNIYYCKQFYQLYIKALLFVPQVDAQTGNGIMPQVGAQIQEHLFAVPWGHHKLIIDKFSDNTDKALFFVRQTVENGWSRSMLENFVGTDLYERQGKALTNFTKLLPDNVSDLAQELTKDPYNFAFTGITEPYNERLLKDALLNNVCLFNNRIYIYSSPTI